MTGPSNVSDVVKLSGGKLVGKTRLQKSVYFLEVFNIGFGFKFTYHHYGPYSEELESCAEDAAALHLIGIDWGYTQDGAKYAVFHDTQSNRSIEGGAVNAIRRDILHILEQYSAVELELAATTDYLFRHGYSNDPWAETRRRKSGKVTDARMGRASQLLTELWAKAEHYRSA